MVEDMLCLLNRVWLVPPPWSAGLLRTSPGNPNSLHLAEDWDRLKSEVSGRFGGYLEQMDGAPGPLRRLLRVQDVALALVITTVTQVEIWAGSVVTPVGGRPAVAALALVGTAPVVVRRRWPLLTLLAVF